MEFIAEALVVLLQILAELFAQLLIELGVRAISRPFRGWSPPPAWVTSGYASLGAALGLGGAHFWPASAARPIELRLFILFSVPVLVGLAFSALGAWRKRRGHAPNSLERFSNAFAFAFALALVRFIGAR